MNSHKKARKDVRTGQAEPHYEPTFEQIQVRAYETSLTGFRPRKS
jgi:hypothetical protein